MIKLSNDHELDFVAASGSYGLDGRGYWWKFWEWFPKWTGGIDKSLLTMVMKTITVESTKGNYRWYAPWRVVKPLTERGKAIPWPIALLRPNLVRGFVNAFALTNPGLWEWKEKHYSVIERLEYKVIVSITGRADECVFMAGEINKLKNIIGIELNLSCPNVHSGPLGVDEAADITSKVFQASRYPIILKLGYTQEYVSIAKKTEEYAEAISPNAVRFNCVFPRESPLKKYGGGAVSGRVSRRFYKRMLSDLKKARVKTSFIMPAWDYEDIQENLELGASAHSFGSVGIPYPERSTEFIRQWQKEEENKRASLGKKSRYTIPRLSENN